MNKKPLLWLVVLLLLVSVASAWTELIMCAGTQDQSQVQGKYSNNFYLLANNFTTNFTQYITTVSQYIGASGGTPTGLRLEIRNDNAGNPGTILAYGTLDHGSVSTGAWNNVTLNESISITSSTQYWVVATLKGQDGEDNGDYYNQQLTDDGCPSVQKQNIDATYEGGSWDVVASRDMLLKLYFTQSQPNSTLNVTLTDSFNGSVINAWSANATWNNGTSETWTTTNGYYYWSNLQNASATVNLSFYGIASNTYYNTSVYNVAVTANTSNTGTTSTYQSILYLTARERISNSSVTGATYYVGTNSTTSRFNITAATHNVTFTHGSYYNLTDSVTTTALTTTNKTISGVYSSLVNVSAYLANGTSISNFGLNVTHDTYTNWTGDFVETTNGTTWFYLINGTYTALINSSEGNQTFSFTVDATTENISFYYFSVDNCSDYTQTMLNFTILNELTDALLNDSILNIWVNASSDYLAEDLQFNFSFDTGNYYALCVPDNTVSEWEINAQAEYSNLPTYDEKNYWFWDYPLNASPTEITLYLANGTTQVTLQVRDYNDDPISDVYVSVLSYDLGTNSYLTTEILKTDSAGDAFAQIIQNTAWYSFILEYEGEIILQTLPTKITTSTLTLRANLDTDYFASYDVFQGISSDLTFNNNTGTFSFTWSDPTGGATQGCLVLTRQSINGETELNSSCSTSSAATLLMVIPESVGTNSYKADGYVTLSGQNFAIETLTHSYNTTYKTFGLSGIFFSMLLILTLVLVGLWHPVAAIVLMAVGVVATNVMGIFYLNWTYIITFIILAGITIYRTGKSE